ncbi:mannose-1-phosphate guanylyltransferase/mannose-6-phosphate isomerase [Psittacicella melopsittaci]|uniref:mannose-1-phosphate guanylyltransferase n=1 Tax=Psittacicella melopsittaci TaxID=2028576 RepID=A0A3A1Y8E9_9GAMM|nr:mannose-1-phosphate guanylyltransferase/mannose-6-phosphate isomerase [Psittacicella melopsittaci]RIY33935.1 mannose-1-phosphate guanylyltransferase/mannose-6-phosphate isomerase [Psittacicella melopsittaci]
MEHKIFPVILAGGTGTRLWPVSRTSYPKQFQTFLGDKSMMQQTLLRLEQVPKHAPIVVCNEEHRFIAAEQLRQLDQLNHNIILEPVGRNTAPAIALGALEALSKDPEAIILVLPADHVLFETQVFTEALPLALAQAQKDKLVTFGIKATQAETGYGYIEQGASITANCFQVQSFKEKPNKEQAQEFIAQDKYLWNSGIFMFKAKTYLETLKKQCQTVYNICFEAYQKAQIDLDFKRIAKHDYLSCPDISIDYAIMENTSQAVVFPLNLTWNDIGSWEALWEILPKDKQGNVIQGEYLGLDSHNNFIKSESSLISTIGVDNLIIVQTRDALFIANKGRSQEAKQIFAQLKEQNHSTCSSHPHVFRPWGSMLLIDQGERYKVKRISVLPGKKVATQLHHHHAEHWIIVSGTARIILEGQEFLVTENQPFYIPVGKKHSIENVGKIPLEFIEVQSGSYLGDDDVIRFESEYYQ